MTHPSDIDIPTHQRLEDGGYPLIGAIFAKGHPSCVSYVRFFSANRPFSISIYGAGVTPLPGETNVFKVETTTLQRRVSYETTPGS
jgi:hypothetical protein